MKRFRALSLITALLLLVSIGLSACGDPVPTAPTATPVAPTSTPKPPSTPTPSSRAATNDEENLIDEVLAETKQLTSYHFEIEVEPSTFITQPMKSEGDYEAPDMVYARGTMGDETFENIVVGNTVFVKNSNGEYELQKESADDSSDPTAVLNPENMITSGNPLKDIDTFVEAASNLQYVGDVQVDGVRVKHFTYDIDLAKMAGEEGMAGIDVSDLDLGGGGFLIDEAGKKLYGVEYNLNMAAFFELIARAFASFGGTPTPGGVKPTPIPRLDVNMVMKITRHNDPSIKVPVTDEMRAMMEEPIEEPTEEIEETPVAEDTPEADETPAAEATEDPFAIPTIPGLPGGDGQTHEGNLGEPVDVGWSRITLNNIKRSSGSDFASPPEGKEYLIVNITVENVGEAEPQNLSSLLMFKLVDAAGTENDQSFFAEMSNPIDSEKPNPLAQGDKVTGDIAYEVDKGATDLFLEFYPYPFFDNDTKAKISINK
ncbi:MAG: DUF4352 domain-containing protein [Chloroflexia bacterium]